MESTSPALKIRRADQRGATQLGWLHSRHSFSFGSYRDPQRMSYRSLRVLNDDVVEPGAGFGEHGHKEMEILSWVLIGALRHRDSSGGGGVIAPGDLQVMSAGSGIRHSEMNASESERVHFLQIWIDPAEQGVAPGYQQKNFPVEQRRDRWRLVASPDGRDDSLRIHQDASLSIADLGAGNSLSASVPAGRHAYLHLATGAIRIGERELRAGDAIAAPGSLELDLTATEKSQLLFFDLA